MEVLKSFYIFPEIVLTFLYFAYEGLSTGLYKEAFALIIQSIAILLLVMALSDICQQLVNQVICNRNYFSNILVIHADQFFSVSGHLVCLRYGHMSNFFCLAFSFLTLVVLIVVWLSIVWLLVVWLLVVRLLFVWLLVV
jgi:hypothetical protein